jgi:hypothetical protein
VRCGHGSTTSSPTTGPGQDPSRPTNWATGSSSGASSCLREDGSGSNGPSEYGGRGLSEIDAIAVMEEFAKAGVPSQGPNDAFSIGMLGNTLLKLGTEEQKHHFLPRIISRRGRVVSGLLRARGGVRPRRGEDPGGARRRRVGHQRPEGVDLGRSSRQLDLRHRPHRPRGPQAPGHLLPARPDGPAGSGGAADRDALRRLASSTRCSSPTPAPPPDHIVGQVNDGWRVAMALLGIRTRQGRGHRLARRSATSSTGCRLAKGTGHRRPLIRERLVRAHERVEIMRFMGYSQLTKFARGHKPRSRRRHHQGLVVRAPHPAHRAGDGHPRPEGLIAEGRGRRRRSGPTTGVPPTAPPAGRRCSSTPGPGRSTPGPTRSSATSSAR